MPKIVTSAGLGDATTQALTDAVDLLTRVRQSQQAACDAGATHAPEKQEFQTLGEQWDALVEPLKAAASNVYYNNVAFEDALKTLIPPTEIQKTDA